MSVFAVVVKDPLAPPLAPAAFLSGLKKINQDSARELLRANPGFLGRGLALPAAEELRAAAASAGLETMLVAETEIAPPPPALRAVKIELKGSGLNSTAAGAVTFIPYETISVICAGAFDAPVEPPDMMALEASVFLKIRNALPGTGPAASEPKVSRETFFRADLLADYGRLRLSLEPENLDFSALGPERTPASLTNFRTLLGKISAPAFGAVKNAFLLAFLAGAPLADLKLASAAACDADFTRLMLFKRR